VDRLFIRGVNWLGDSVMTLPALAAFCAAYPGVRIGLAAPAGVIPLWQLCPYVDGLFPLEKGLRAEWRTARAIRAWQPDRAVVFPNSFRSAWLPFLAGVKERIGSAGRFRRLLLTRIVEVAPSGHHALRYYDLLELPRPAEQPEIRGHLRLDPEWSRQVIERVRGIVGEGKAFPSPEREGWLAVLPGAARGVSKCWPADRFAAAAGRVAAARGMGVVIAGSSSEVALCRTVAEGIRSPVVSVAGRTNAAELAAVLAAARVVLCNDSGGMHLAAAVGTPVAALFGVTDPARTGPLGDGHRVVMAPGVRRSEAVARRSEAARAALEAVPVEAAVEALEAILDAHGKE